MVVHRQERYHAFTAMRKLQITLCAAAVLLAACRDAKPRVQAADSAAVEFEMRTFEKTRPGCGDHGSRAQACVSFRAVWPEMKGGAGNAAAKMNAAVLAAIGFPEGPAKMDPFGDELIEHWRVEHRGAVYNDSTWFERRSVQVLARRPGVWSFQVDRIGQTGAALPFNERTYLNLNPRTGDPVVLSDLLARGGESRLVELAEQRLRAEMNLSGDAPLPFKEAPLSLPGQFALSPAGITLRWSGDALRAPLSAPVEIAIPWSDARDLVQTTAVQPPPDAVEGF